MSDDSTGARVSSPDSSPPPNPARDREQSVTDASEPPQSEIARLLERVSDAFLSLDARWHCTYLNSQAARLLGREANGLIGRNYWTEFPDDVGQPFYRACHRSLTELIPIQIEEYFAPTDRWFETRVYPSADGLSVFFQDITERRRGQERLQESERRLAEAQRIARLGGWEWDVGSGAVKWSDELLRMVGWDAPAPDRADTVALVHPDDYRDVRRRVLEAVERGGGIDFENRLLCPDGREIVVHNWGHVERDAAGRPRRLIAVAQDVTEPRKTEVALRESRQHLQAISEEAPVSIVISRMSDGTVLYANPFAHRLFGVAPDADLSRHVSVEFYQNPAERAEIVRLLALHPLVGPREMGLKLLDGTPIWVVGSFQRLTYGGEEAVLATHHDLTERNQAEAARQVAEENYRALFMDAVGGIFQTSPEGRYLQVNPALARIYGYETPEQMIGELTDVSRQLYVEAGRRAEFERLMKHQGFVSRFESQVRRRDGSVIWIAESARPIWDASGALLRYEGFVEDVSDRKALEAQQAYALQEAIEQADRDSVTGLLNHRAFYKRLEEETARAEREGTTLAVVMLDLDNFGFFNNVYGHTAGDHVLRQVAERLQEVCRPYDTLARFGGDEFALLLPRVGHTTSGEIEARLRTDLGVLSFRPEGHESAIPITVSVGSALRSDSLLDRQEVVRQADERLMRSKTGGAVEADQVRRSAQGAVAGFSMLDALVTAVDNKDRYTRKHSEDVMRYSLRIARALGLDEAALQTVAVGALLHDVGKIGIPDAILRKPGKLTGEEFEAIKQHPQMGAIIVGAVPGLEGTLDAVRHHHERWDGGGYPLGLRGEGTPLIARLMAVADAYSAMTTDRPYRKGMDRTKALAILEAEAGAQWDARCVQAFLQTEESEDER